jgi:alpha-galactosidase
MNRKKFIRSAGLSLTALIIGDPFSLRSEQKNRIQMPDNVRALMNGHSITLTKDGANHWQSGNLHIELIEKNDNVQVQIAAPGISLESITLEWEIPINGNSLLLNDQWERTYGDVLWQRKPAKPFFSPWYFMENNAGNLACFGVRTGANSFCSWEVKEKTINLTLDTRNGAKGVQLQDRILHAAEIVVLTSDNESAFGVARNFMKLMCPASRMPKQPVYGINDWYFTYGNNSEQLILEHTRLIASMAEGLANRPFSVVDAGWFKGSAIEPNDCCWGNDMKTPNQKFPDMPRLAESIKKEGMRPGIWTRPLCGSFAPPNLALPVIEGREKKNPVLDPSIPENLETIKNYFKLYTQWGFEMVKFDFTSFDIFGKWGFQMVSDQKMTSPDWSMNDKTKTNAEIVLALYKAIRDAAGETYIIGCNTFSHLSAGLFELNRIGDDTSGKEWARTLKMGVNTLAFRGVQHNSFYAADPDCVGLTRDVPWDKNKQWMELVARSGVPLFISAQPEAIHEEQRAAIKKYFGFASRDWPLGEPIDWLHNHLPSQWKFGEESVKFDWE